MRHALLCERGAVLAFENFFDLVCRFAAKEIGFVALSAIISYAHENRQIALGGNKLVRTIVPLFAAAAEQSNNSSNVCKDGVDLRARAELGQLRLVKEQVAHREGDGRRRNLSGMRLPIEKRFVKFVEQLLGIALGLARADWI